MAEYPKNYHQQLTVRVFNKKLLATRLPEYGHLQKGKSDGARGYKGIELKKGHELPNNDTSPIRVGIQGIDDF